MGFSPGDWQIFFAIGLVVGQIWLANGMTDFGRIAKQYRASWMRYLFGFIWAALIVTTTLGLGFWARHTDGRDHYTASIWIASIGTILCILFSPIFFGLFHYGDRSTKTQRKWMIGGFFVVVAAFGCFLTVTGLQLDAYVDSGSPNDVEAAFWLTLPLTIWLGIAAVWAGLWAWKYYDEDNLEKTVTKNAQFDIRGRFKKQVV
jgi:hypothetical protein